MSLVTQHFKTAREADTLKAFDIHKYSESENNLGQIDRSKSTRKELETAHMKPLCAALGFH